jgi:hypothetical protein
MLDEVSAPQAKVYATIETNRYIGDKTRCVFGIGKQGLSNKEQLVYRLCCHKSFL